MPQPPPLLIVPEEPGPDTIAARVTRVFDGDGFLALLHAPPGHADIEASIRLGFIDAPESDQPGGPEARAFLAQLIEGKTLHLVVLLKTDTNRTTDRHRRIVCMAYVTEEYPAIDCWTAGHTRHRTHRFGSPQSITRNIELEMVLNGWAWVLDRYGPDERYALALQDARDHRRGIWAQDSNIPPWEFKRRKIASQRQKQPPPTPKPRDLFTNIVGPERNIRLD